MGTTIDWTITNLITINYQNETNYVVQASYQVKASNDKLVGTYEGSVEFTATEESSFIPYNDLTEQIVLGWVKTALGVAVCQGLEDCCLAQIKVQVDNASLPTPQRPDKPF